MVRTYLHAHVFTPESPSGCQGFASSTQEQCGWNTSEKYCRHHGNQAGRCCRAISRTGYRCTERIHVDGGGYFCEVHCDWATPRERVCQGEKVNGVPCHRRVLHPNGYLFCMHQHDPRVHYYNPRLLRRPRNLELDDQHGMDPYNRGRDLADGKLNHCDHIIDFQIGSFDRALVNRRQAEELHDTIVSTLNAPFNQCDTLAATNESKGTGVTLTLDDMMVYSLTEYGNARVRALDDIRHAAFNNPIVPTLTDRFRQEGLSRDSTRLISNKMGEAFVRVVAEFADQGETPSFDRFAHVTTSTALAMGINLRHFR